MSLGRKLPDRPFLQDNEGKRVGELSAKKELLTCKINGDSYTWDRSDFDLEFKQATMAVVRALSDGQLSLDESTTPTHALTGVRIGVQPNTDGGSYMTMSQMIVVPNDIVATMNNFMAIFIFASFTFNHVRTAIHLLSPVTWLKGGSMIVDTASKKGLPTAVISSCVAVAAIIMFSSFNLYVQDHLYGMNTQTLIDMVVSGKEDLTAVPFSAVQKITATAAHSIAALMCKCAYVTHISARKKIET
jgi:hypothetical protein